MKLLRGVLVFVGSAVLLYLATQVLAWAIGPSIRQVTLASKSALENVEPFGLAKRYLAVYGKLDQPCVTKKEASESIKACRLRASEIGKDSKEYSACSLSVYGSNRPDGISGRKPLLLQRKDSPPEIKRKDVIPPELVISEAQRHCMEIVGRQQAQAEQALAQCENYKPTFCMPLQAQYRDFNARYRREWGPFYKISFAFLDIPYAFGLFVYDLVTQPFMTAAVQILQVMVGLLIGGAFLYWTGFIPPSFSWLLAIWIGLALAGTILAAGLAMGVLWLVEATSWLLSLLIPAHPEIFSDADGHLTFSAWGASLVTISQASAVHSMEGGLHHRIANFFERLLARVVRK